jgi:pimeloyl-ACP methyl ester carboxylesterase
LKSKCHLGTSSLSNQTNVINLSYDSNDKFNSKSALVIAHGLFASKASWRAMARRINDATKQRVYTVDMRNHGNSVPYVDSMTYLDMAGDLESFINRIVVEKDKCECVTMMGHSMGGKSTMALVLSDKLNPKNLDKIIVADIAPSTSPSLLNISKILEKLCTIDLSEVSSNLFAARKEIDAKLCEVDVLKNVIFRKKKDIS